MYSTKQVGKTETAPAPAGTAAGRLLRANQVVKRWHA